MPWGKPRFPHEPPSSPLRRTRPWGASRRAKPAFGGESRCVADQRTSEPDPGGSSRDPSLSRLRRLRAAEVAEYDSGHREAAEACDAEGELRAADLREPAGEQAADRRETAESEEVE